MSAGMKPLLLLIPGTLNDASLWSDVVRELSGAAEIRIADVTRQSSVDEMARDAWALAGDAQVHRPLVVAGFSLGGYVALEMLAAPARPVHALVLVSTSARGEPDGQAPMREKTIRAFERDFARAVAATVAFTTHEPPAELIHRLEAMMLAVGAASAIRQTRAVMTRRDHRSTAASLAMPVSVLCGREDRVTPPELSHELAQLIPHAQLRIVDGAGHLLPAEKPHEVVHALRELLERCQLENS
jgi:pimeloyl-ACP methyl ester carboxylesterase